MAEISFPKLKDILYKEGYHILLLSDWQLNRLINLAPHICRWRNVVKGLTLPDRNEIAINKSLNLKERVLTLIHELVHLADKNLTEDETEEVAQKLYRNFNNRELGFMEFATSHDS